MHNILFAHTGWILNDFDPSKNESNEIVRVISLAFSLHYDEMANGRSAQDRIASS